MAAETNASEQESQIQEKTISSQTEDLKKKVENVDDDERPALNGNHTENNGNGVAEPSTGVDDDERQAIDEEESNEADAGIPDEPPTSLANNEAAVHNEADSGTAPDEDGSNGNNEADSGIDEQPSESIEADSGSTIDEATPSAEVDTTQGDEGSAVESVTSTATVASKTEETNGKDVKDKEEKTEKKDTSLGSTVAKHYNEISPITRESRKESRIFHLRNFNNWVKSVVISEFLEKVKRRKRLSDDVNVLDIACGKGGDILKWHKGKIDHVIMADIAAKSIDECKERYRKLEKDQRHSRYHRERLFSAEFFVADCTKKRLNDMYKNKGIKLDMASCQFAFHYSFESYEQADLMLKNCCENLRVGGYFIGTTPDAQKLVKHIKACKADSFGNSVFNIKPDDKESFPLFGSKYMFYLEGVVDCPEFIVYLPLLEKMAAKYNMKLVWKKNFHDLFKEYHQQYSSLISRMSALESYPSSSGQQAGGSESQYKSAKDYVDKKGNRKVGTLSADEWEVAGLYIAFAFEKTEPPRDKKRDDRRDDRREDRKRTRDDRGNTDRGRSDDRHRKSSDSKRSRRDVEEEYEIKDEVYDDDDKPEDRSRSERSSKSSRSSSSNRRSHRDERSDSSRSKKRDSSSSRKGKSESSSSSSKEERKGEKAEKGVESSKEATETEKSQTDDAAAVSSSEPKDAEIVPSSDAVVEENTEVESTTTEGEVSTAVDKEEVESTTDEAGKDVESTVTSAGASDVDEEEDAEVDEDAGEEDEDAGEEDEEADIVEADEDNVEEEDNEEPMEE